MKHDDIWRALDTLAAENGLSPSGLAKRAGLDPAKFDLKTFHPTYASRMLRQGFDVRTVQHWMGHKSLETTMRYLVPATDVHGKLDQVKIPVKIPAPPKKSPPRKSPARETGSARKGRPARFRSGKHQEQ